MATSISILTPPPRTRRNGRRRQPYALSHVYLEYHTLTWQMKRVIALARNYPMPDAFSSLDAEESAVLTTFADRLEVVYAELCRVLSPSIKAAMQQEHQAFEDHIARYDTQGRRGEKHA